MYKKRQEKLKKKLQEPIEMPDLGDEISEYERIRERIIKERNDALKAAAKEYGFDFNRI